MSLLVGCLVGGWKAVGAWWFPRNAVNRKLSGKS